MNVGLRQVPGPHRLRDEDSGGAPGIEDLPRIGRVESDRLLDEDVLSGGDRGERLFAVERMRGGDVHDVDLRVVHERVDGCVYARDAVGVGEGTGLRRVPCGHGDRPLRCVLVDGMHELVGDAGADDAPAECGNGGGIDQAGRGKKRHPAILSHSRDHRGFSTPSPSSACRSAGAMCSAYSTVRCVWSYFVGIVPAKGGHTASVHVNGSDDIAWSPAFVAARSDSASIVRHVPSTALSHAFGDDVGV